MVDIYPYGVLLSKAEASYLKKDYIVAKFFLLEILQSSPRDTKANELLGFIYIDEDKAGDAIECFKIAVEAKDCSLISLYKLASLYAEKESYLLSIKYLKRIFAADSYSLEIALEIASLCVITEQYSELLVWLSIADKISPNNKEILYNIGRAYDEIYDASNAIKFYEEAIEVDKNFIEPIFNIGTIYSGQKKYRLALKYFIRAYEIDASYDYLLGDIIFSLKNLCMWCMEDKYTQIFYQAANLSSNLISPFQYLSMVDSPAKQLEIARNFSLNKYQRDSKSDLMTIQKECDRIKIAYLSSDFRTHAMAFLTTQLFEYHDKNRFELYAVSLSPLTEEDPWTIRIKNTFENFIDASSKSDNQVVQMMRDIGIDIAIDLMGHTALSRTMIFAKRVAPIQINFLGYPGTMGAQFIDYIVADTFLVPSDCREFYSENIIYMPHTFQPNDSIKKISKKISSRAQLGLPDTGFVFCCFNSMYKINKEIFYTWIDILNSVPKSVLWLCSENEDIQANLREHIRGVGITSDRLIFSKPTSYGEYLETYMFADLFLDTAPFNAGTTARDALWCGLPVLTIQGKSFAGRMASSLLKAIGMDHLVTQDLGEYKAIAIKLAQKEECYRSIKNALMAKKEGSSFSIEPYTRSLETAYERVFEVSRSGAPKEDLFLS